MKQKSFSFSAKIFFLQIFLTFICVLSTNSTFAQNPLQDAYQYGYNLGKGNACYRQGVEALCNEEFYDAFTSFLDGIDYNSACYEGLGVCYELGFGVDVDRDDAWEMYSLGAKKGNFACRMHLQRIQKSGYWSKSFRSTFLKNLKASQGVDYGASPNFGGFNNSSGYSGGSSSSNTVTCSGCGGTGRCTGCGGSGKMKSSAYYTDGHTIISNCPSCSGSGRCGVCYGRGSL